MLIAKPTNLKKKEISFAIGNTALCDSSND